MLAHAEIGVETNSYKYLRQWEGLSDHLEDTQQMLACLSTRLELPHIICENIICKFPQDQTEAPPKPKTVPNPPSQTKVTRKTRVNVKVPKKIRKDRSKASDEQPVWKSKTNPYRDSIYRKQSLYYQDERQRLVKVTASGSRAIKPISSIALHYR